MSASLSSAPQEVWVDLDELMRRLRVLGFGELLDHILLVLNWGSRVYGTHRPESDFDFIIVLAADAPVNWERYHCDFSEELYFDDGHVNGSMCLWGKFEAKFYEHRMELLELLYLPPAHVWLCRCPLPVIHLDLAVLRRALFYEVHHSLQKGRRHLFEDHLPRKMKKEIFHAYRYVLFAEQLLEHGRIVDFSVANHLWFEMDADHSSGAELLAQQEKEAQAERARKTDAKEAADATQQGSSSSSCHTRQKQRGSKEQHVLWEHYQHKYVSVVQTRKAAIAPRLPFVSFHKREEVSLHLIPQAPRVNFASAFHDHLHLSPLRSAAEQQQQPTAVPSPADLPDPAAQISSASPELRALLLQLLADPCGGVEHLRTLGFRTFRHPRLDALCHLSSRAIAPWLAAAQPSLARLLHGGAVLDLTTGSLLALGMPRLCSDRSLDRPLRPSDLSSASTAEPATAAPPDTDQLEAPDLDWSRAVRVSEKSDGTAVMLYVYRGEWLLSLASDPFGEGVLTAIDPIYAKKNKRRQPPTQPKAASGHRSSASACNRDAFWTLWAQLGYRLPSAANSDNANNALVSEPAHSEEAPVAAPRAPSSHTRCYLFDMCLQHFRYVCEVPRHRLVLLAVRDMRTLRELDPASVAEAHGWECASSPFADVPVVSSVAQALTLVNAGSPWVSRGVVLRDHRFERLSVESHRHSLLSTCWFDSLEHGAVPNLSIAEDVGDLQWFRMALCGQIDRLARFPQYRTRAQELLSMYIDFCATYDRFYQENAHRPRKEYATQAKTTVFKFQLAFGMRDTGLSAHETILQLLRPKLSALLGWVNAHHREQLKQQPVSPVAAATTTTTTTATTTPPPPPLPPPPTIAQVNVNEEEEKYSPAPAAASSSDGCSPDSKAAAASS